MLECVKNEVIPHDVVTELREAGIMFYEGLFYTRTQEASANFFSSYRLLDCADLRPPLFLVQLRTEEQGQARPRLNTQLQRVDMSVAKRAFSHPKAARIRGKARREQGRQGRQRASSGRKENISELYVHRNQPSPAKNHLCVCLQLT